MSITIITMVFMNIKIVIKAIIVVQVVFDLKLHAQCSLLIPNKTEAFIKIIIIILMMTRPQIASAM